MCLFWAYFIPHTFILCGPLGTKCQTSPQYFNACLHADISTEFCSLFFCRTPCTIQTFLWDTLHSTNLFIRIFISHLCRLSLGPASRRREEKPFFGVFFRSNLAKCEGNIHKLIAANIVVFIFLHLFAKLTLKFEVSNRKQTHVENPKLAPNYDRKRLKC